MRHPNICVCERCKVTSRGKGSAELVKLLDRTAAAMASHNPVDNQVARLSAMKFYSSDHGSLWRRAGGSRLSDQFFATILNYETNAFDRDFVCSSGGGTIAG